MIVYFVVAYVIVSLVALTLMQQTGEYVVDTWVWVLQILTAPFVAAAVVLLVSDIGWQEPFMGTLAGALVAFIAQKRFEWLRSDLTFDVTLEWANDAEPAAEATTESSSG